MANNMIVPLSFSQVQEGVYRSAYPATKSLPFIKQLGLKSMVCLSPNDIRPDLEEFCSENEIALHRFDLKHNQDPFVIMSEDMIKDILEVIQKPENFPVLLFCTAGKVRTGCVVGCLRKRSGWSMASIIQEFELFTEPEGLLCDLHFIDAFE